MRAGGEPAVGAFFASKVFVDMGIFDRGFKGSGGAENPFVRWIIVEVPHTFGTCHDVEVIRFVAMRNDDGVIAARH